MSTARNIMIRTTRLRPVARIATGILAVTGLGFALAAPAHAVTGRSITGTWNVRTTPGGALAGKVGPGPADVDCQAGGPSVTIPGVGTSAVWDHVRGRGYVTSLAVSGTGKKLPACAATPAATPAPAPAPVLGAGSIVGLAGKCLHVRGGKSRAGAAVQLHDCNGSAAQRWTRSGTTLRALDKCLDTAGQATGNGTRAQLSVCTGAATQAWQLTGGNLRNTASGRCLDVFKARSANGTRTSLWTCNGHSNQTWNATLAAAPAPTGYQAQILGQAATWATGSKGGQCKVWAAKVVNAVLARETGARIGGYESAGGAYWGSYANAGGRRVPVDQAAPGDLIQTNNPADRTSNKHYRAMHSAIIVALTGTPGTFVVRDSNWHGDEVVTEHLWTPATTAAKHGLESNYWRFGPG